ncbi:hypothetical protein C0416_01515 [bacterium]|nr:hypothetical protein [bacterium]
MNPDRNNQHIEGIERHIESQNKPNSFLDSIRALSHRTHTRVLVLATLAGLGLSTGCDMDLDKDKTEFIENQNELYKGCEPFTMCQTSAVYDGGTSELIGFSLMYRVPEGKEFTDVSFRILEEDGTVIHEEIKNLPSGSDKIKFTDRDIPGVSDANVVEMIVDDKTVKLPVNFKSYDDDDDPVEF